MFWTMGSLNGKGWNQILTVLPYVAAGLLLLFTSCRELDIMLVLLEHEPLMGRPGDRAGGK